MSGSRYNSLDHWRGLACLIVVAVHSVMYTDTFVRLFESPLSQPDGPASVVVAIVGRGWWGVPMFFVISGYCITATAQATIHRDRTIIGYFRRRLWRIFPPYWATCALALAAAAAFPSLTSPAPVAAPVAIQWSIPAVLGNITLTETWRHYIVPQGTPSLLLGQAWTLCYEEQFYAVVGVILLLARRRFFEAATCITFGVLMWRYLIGPAFRMPLDGLFIDGHWLAFAAGILVYHSTNVAERRWPALLLLAVAAVFYARPYELASAMPNNFAQSMFVAMLFAMLLVLLRPFDHLLSRSALLRPLQWCGTMCYSLYLVHYPICRGVSHWFAARGVTDDFYSLVIVLPACWALSLAAGAAFYFLVERWFLNTTSQGVQPTTGCTHPPRPFR